MKKLLIVLLAATATASIALPATAQTATTNSDSESTSSQAASTLEKPDYNYLRNYLKNPQTANSKNVDLASAINRVDRAEKAKLAGKDEKAKALLLKTSARIQEIAEKGRLQPLYAQQYAQAVDNLIKSWSAPVARVNGGYPDKWHNAPLDSTVDSWGMYNRQSVSYAAFRVHDSGRYMPYWGGKGNAKQWPDNARAAGIPVDTIPKISDVAISTLGVYGHAAYVEEVMPDGSVRVSQYNQKYDGLYGESIIPAWATHYVYIHFPYDESN